MSKKYTLKAICAAEIMCEVTAESPEEAIAIANRRSFPGPSKKDTFRGHWRIPLGQGRENIMKSVYIESVDEVPPGYSDSSTLE